MLDEIIKNKLKEVSQLKSSFDISKIDISAPKKPFYETLLLRQRSKKNSIIAEIKKRSPSKGVLDSNLNVSEKALQYEAGGASCLSVLTDKDYFSGSIDDLLVAKKSVNLPVLRKDFIIDELQVYQSKMIGADCILLIASALSHKLFEELYSLAASLNLDVLAEVHNIDELDFVKSLGIKLLGINNRNLKTFEVDINTSVHLSESITDEETVIFSEGTKLFFSSQPNPSGELQFIVNQLNQSIEKAKHFGFDLTGAVMASDAFFPFQDCVKIANNAGIIAVIQPGGSIKDQLSIDYCNGNNLAMVMTGVRHFKH